MRSALALALLLAAPWGWAQDEQDELPVRLELSAERRVRALQVDELLREFQLAFTRIECPARLLGLEEDPEDEPSLVLAVHVERWRERNLPGGRPVLDPSTGRDRPGYVREVDVRFLVTVSSPGLEEPLFEKKRRVRRSRGTLASIDYDPDPLARRDATRWVIKESLRPLCKEVEKALRTSN